MAYRLPSGMTGLWTPTDGDCPLADYVIRGGVLEAHNAAFEANIWAKVCVPKYGWPTVRPEQWRDSMAACAVMALPLSLEKAGAALNAPQQKDPAGKAVMMKLALPRKPTKNDKREWFDDAPLFEKLYAYCKQDVAAEHAISALLPPLTPAELELWHTSEAINRRGVYVDKPAVQAAMRIMALAEADYYRQIREATGNVINEDNIGSWQVIVPWCHGRGVFLPNYQKGTLEEFVTAGELPADVEIVLKARLATGRTSTAKYQAMLDRMSADGRIREMYMHHGANTGRAAGRGLQPQNFPRGGFKVEMVDACLRDMATLGLEDFRFLWGDPMRAASYCLRGCLTAAPGKVLVSADLSAIEARIADWLAGQEDALVVWRAFDAGIGPDAYKSQASKALHLRIDQITDELRQLGKIQKLSCQFGAGHITVREVASKAPYFVTLSEDEAKDLVNGYRETHQHVKSMWYQMENAALAAIRAPGIVQDARGIRFKMQGPHLKMRLPSGRLLSYPFAKVEQRMTPWGEWKDAVTFMAEVGEGHVWMRTHTYGGSLFENAVQAIDRDIAYAAMLRAEARGFPVVLHTHDDLTSEIDESNPATDKDFSALMRESPGAWAAGLPIAAAGWRGIRNRKG